MARVRVLCGPHRSKRAQRTDDLIRGQWGHSLLLVPTPQRAQRRREQLLLDGGLQGGWGQCVTTFRRFALSLLQSTQVPVRELCDVERRLLLEQVVARMRRDRDDPPPALASRGFVGHLQQVITQLKQAAVDPPFFKERIKGRRHPSWLDPLVAEAYEAYQEALQARQAYDVVGLYWQAALACADGAPPLLRDVRLIALDGFDDFTPSEFRLLQALAPHVDMLVFAVACNRIQPSQSDVYRIPIRTASLLQKAFDADQEDLEETPAATYTHFAASHIFPRDMPPSPEGLTSNIQLLPCATVGIEAEVIARRVKTLLLEKDIPASSIVIVHRDLQAAAPRLLAALAEAGVPVQIERPQRLSESAFGHFLLLLLESWDSWERPALEEVLASAFFTPWPEFDTHRAAARTILRLACGVRGYPAVRRSLTAFIERLQRSDTTDRIGGLRSHPAPMDAAQEILRAVDYLHERERALRACTASKPFADAVWALCEQLAPQEVIERLPASLRDAEESAWSTLRETVARYAAWHADMDDSGKKTWPELTAELRQMLAEGLFTPPSARNGVLVLDADAVRHVDPEVVFLTGMNAGVFPRPARVNAIYSEADLRDLQDCEIPLESKQKQVDRELLLFQQVLNSARRQLYISWAHESAAGRELLRSPFVGDLADLFEPGMLNESSEGRRAVPEPCEVAGWRDLRAAAATADALPPAVIRGQLAGMFDRIELERTRQGFAPFGIFDGILVTDALVQGLHARFGADHVYSADQLETYAECPFSFFARRVLDVQETEAAGAEIDARLRGSIFHDVLQRLYEAYRGQSPATIALEEAEARVTVLLDAAFERLRRRGTASEGLLTAEQTRAARILARHLRLHLHDDEWTPSHFEVSFGRVKERSDDPCNRLDPVVLQTEGGPIRLAGKIDRIDVSDACVRIIDYKSSVHVGHADVEDGISLQLLLYALAVEEHLLPGKECAQAVLLQIGSKKAYECLNRAGKARGDRLDWAAREGVLRRRVTEYVKGIQGGIFPPRPYKGKPCAFCVLRRVCRYDKARIERKEGAAREVD